MIHALYFAAFVSLPTGGATIICDPAIEGFPHAAKDTGAVTLLCGNGGNGRQVIHCVASGHCAICGEHCDPNIAHIGVARSLGDLGAWWDYPIAAQSPISWTWVEQCFRPPAKATTKRELPEILDADELGCLSGGGESSPPGILSACIGLGYGGGEDPRPVSVDLAEQGPHAVIVGTTGSGKSVALLTWILSLASRYRPDRLRMVLIDYKGGATCGALTSLPHVEAVLTDLHPARTQRALIGVRTLLRQREHVLAEAGFSDLSQWEAAARTHPSTPPPPPRVLIACDEFTALSSQHPGAFTLLMSLAAQGRSLGLHVLLATQRPDQALTPGLLANIDLRLALRCREEAASQLLVGSAEAARLPRIPGRAVLSDYGILQCAWIPDVDHAVTSILHSWREILSAQSATITATPPLWAPDLPEVLSWRELPPAFSSGALPIALLDGISRGAHEVLHWVGGHIRIEGTRRNEAQIATSVRTLAHSIALQRHLPLHVCTTSPTAWTRSTPSLSSAADDSVTSLLPCSDSASTALLLHEVSAHGPCVIAIEDQPAILRALERDLGIGTATQLWNHLVHNAAAQGITLVLGHPEQPSLWDREAGNFSYRLMAAHHDHELQRIGLTHAHPTDPYPGRYLLLNAPEGSHHLDTSAAEHSCIQLQIPLEWHPGCAALPSPDSDVPSWRVRSPQLLSHMSSMQTPATLNALADVYHPTEEASSTTAKAQLLSGAGLDVTPLPEAQAVTIIADKAHLYAKALGLLGEDGKEGATLLSPQEWTKLSASPSPIIVAFQVRDEVGRALSLRVGGGEPWILKGSQEWHSGVIVRDGRLERCVLSALDLPR